MPITTRNGRRTYTVHGMTCDHCVRAVREEVGAVAGVTRVDVDLASGRMTISGTGLDDRATIAAVVDAGYQAVRA